MAAMCENLQRSALLTYTVLALVVERPSRAIDANTNDYYELLGLARGTRYTESDLKKAYRKQARKYHPEVNKSDNAQDIFMKITKGIPFLIPLDDN